MTLESSEELKATLDPITGTLTLRGVASKADIRGLQDEITLINERLVQLPSQNQPVDLAPILARLDNLTLRIEALEAGIPTPTPTPTPTISKLSGTPFGTEGFYQNNPANGYLAVFDGKIETAFDSTTATGAIAGLNFGQTRIIKKIRFHPRTGIEFRSIGGKFETSMDGTSYQLIHTIESQVDGWNELPVNNIECRFFRFLSPENGYGNIAEIEVYGV